jgi:tetratricopeptide (TPR) repeat protein
MDFFKNRLKRGGSEENPTDALGWTAKGINLTKLGRFEEGLECFSNAIRLDGGYEPALINIGVCYASLHNHTMALFWYKSALDLNPQSEEALYNKGRSEVGLGEYEDAVSSFTETLKLDPQSVDAWENKGYCLIKLGRYAEAKLCNDKAKAIDPERWYKRENARVEKQNKELMDSLRRDKKRGFP